VAHALDVGEEVVHQPTEAEVGVIAAESPAPQARQMAGEPGAQVMHKQTPIHIAIVHHPL
jgi:hypothetical protein